MASTDQYLLSDADVQFLRQLKAERDAMSVNTRNRFASDENVDYAPEVYKALVPAGGIPALTFGPGSGTGSGDDPGSTGNIPGFATCGIYRVLHGDLLFQGFTRIIYNSSLTTIPQQTWVTAVRDKWGIWWAQPGQESSPITVGGVSIQYNGSYVGSEGILNFVDSIGRADQSPGGETIGATDDPGNFRINLAFGSATAFGGGGTIQYAGAVPGTFAGDVNHLYWGFGSGFGLNVTSPNAFSIAGQFNSDSSGFNSQQVFGTDSQGYAAEYHNNNVGYGFYDVVICPINYTPGDSPYEHTAAQIWGDDFGDNALAVLGCALGSADTFLGLPPVVVDAYGNSSWAVRTRNSIGYEVHLCDDSYAVNILAGGLNVNGGGIKLNGLPLSANNVAFSSAHGSSPPDVATALDDIWSVLNGLTLPPW